MTTLRSLTKKNLKEDFKNWKPDSDFKHDKGQIFVKTFAYKYEDQEEDDITEIVYPVLNFTWKKQRKGILLSTRFLPFLKFSDTKLKWITVPADYRRTQTEIFDGIQGPEIHITHYMALLGFWRMFSVFLWLIFVFSMTALLISLLWRFGLRPN